MSVSRATFVATAEALRTLPEPYRTQQARVMADQFARQNPRFDRARFMRAAGVDE